VSFRPEGEISLGHDSMQNNKLILYGISVFIFLAAGIFPKLKALIVKSFLQAFE
jgi:hypothetical protein